MINKLVGLLHSSYAPIEKMESPSRSMLPWQRVINSQAGGPTQATGPRAAMPTLWRDDTRAKVCGLAWHLAGRAPPGKVVFGTAWLTGARHGGTAGVAALCSVVRRVDLAVQSGGMRPRCAQRRRE